MSASEREVFGHWSIDGRAPIEGRLLIEEDGHMDLQLRGSVPSGQRISGRLSSGADATLFSAGLVSRDSNRHFFEAHRIESAVLGLELENEEEPRLISGTRQPGGLREVLGISGLSIETAAPNTNQGRFARVEWKGTDPLVVKLPEGELSLANYARFERDSDFRYSLQHSVEARFEAAEPTGLAQIERVFEVLCAFLAFAIEARIAPGSLRVRARLERGKAEEGEVIWKARPMYGEAPEEVEPWLNLSRLENPAAAVAGFYRFSEAQAAAYLILFELQVFFAALNAIDKLLYLARFLEVYHRTRFPGLRDSEGVHDARTTLVKEALGEEHKEWGARLLFHSNEITFKERIVALLRGPAAAAAPIVGGTPESFAKLVGDCRNYWTHYSPELEPRALRDVELDQLDDRIMLVVRACILDDIGVDSGEALAALEADWRWERYAGLPLAQRGGEGGPG